MERRNLVLLCAGVVCFWLFALAFGTAQDSGLRWVEAQSRRLCRRRQCRPSGRLYQNSRSCPSTAVRPV